LIFYKEVDFREDKIGRLPSEWQIVKLGTIAEIRGNKRIQSFNTIAFIPMKLVSESQILVQYEIRRREDVKSYTYCEAGDLLLAKITPSLENGKQGIVPSDVPGGFALATTEVFPICCKQMDASFLFYLLKFPKYRNKVISSMTGTTGRQRASKIGVTKLEIPLPYPYEQKKIVEVLSCVDLAIQKTDEVIAKTERLKKGLMQELLTNGIGHKEFKDTEIGKIPKKWDLVRLKNVVEINKESRDPSKDMPERNFLYVDIDSIERGTGKIGDSKTILGIKAPSRARRVIHENDVIMSTVRPYLKAFAIIPKEYEDQICSTGFAVLSSTKKILSYFLLTILFSDQTMNQCNRMMMGGQYPALNESQVSKIKIPLPPLSEQERIAEIFLALDDKLELEKQEKEGLERIKQGSMDLLLTGKVRVNVD